MTVVTQQPVAIPQRFGETPVTFTDADGSQVSRVWYGSRYWVWEGVHVPGLTRQATPFTSVPVQAITLPRVYTLDGMQCLEREWSATCASRLLVTVH